MEDFGVSEDNLEYRGNHRKVWIALDEQSRVGGNE